MVRSTKTPFGNDGGLPDPSDDVASQGLGVRPAASEGIQSPITIIRRPDGRIGVGAGALSAPTLVGSLQREDHARAIASCRFRAEELRTVAVSRSFQGRPEYAETLSAYLEWLPARPGIGNILLADGEARVLNKLFSADQAILPTPFAGRLSVLLEDHIGLRQYYPQIETHYHAIRTGRLPPLSRDAVEAIRRTIHDNTPDVFDESVSPAMDETAKPAPDIKPSPFQGATSSDLERPKPPKDPIAEVDSTKLRNFVFASATNRIWQILASGKSVHDGAQRWLMVYEQFKPYINAFEFEPAISGQTHMDFVENFPIADKRADRKVPEFRVDGQSSEPHGQAHKIAEGEVAPNKDAVLHDVFWLGCLLFAVGVAAGLLSIFADSLALSAGGALLLGLAGWAGLSLLGRPERGKVVS